MALATASTNLMSVVRSLRGGEDVLSSRISAASARLSVCGGVETMSVGFQQRSVTGLKTCKEDRVRTLVAQIRVLGIGHNWKY